MKKSDVQCLDCSAGFRRIELISRNGEPGCYRCLCGRTLEVFDGSSEVVYRLTVAPGKSWSSGDKRLSTDVGAIGPVASQDRPSARHGRAESA